jgi:hypothetical protein
LDKVWDLLEGPQKAHLFQLGQQCLPRLLFLDKVKALHQVWVAQQVLIQLLKLNNSKFSNLLKERLKPEDLHKELGLHLLINL